MNHDLVRITAVAEITEILKYFNDYFPRSIESRVGNLVLYAEKLAAHAYIYVTKATGLISGVVIFYANDLLSKIAYLTVIAVSVEYRHQGVGSLLLQQCCALSRSCGMTQMKLEVDKSNTKAIAHYEHHGFFTVHNGVAESQTMIKEL
ncbi:GNAT family N-acetyltransferase [Paenibacillus lutrae]|uniref:GNAT family N-acetyltransferase n=1 Tax=Paenibacillus lutrae TaxID=2078573 RepID=A0A7X3K034_9BACL|nr:GNAT family N-acetyltransferase [Paenibacillus lutrae]